EEAPAPSPAASAAAVVRLSPPAPAPPPPPRPTVAKVPPDPHAHRHDGFFLRLLSGPQYVTASDGHSKGFGQAGLGVSLALGGTPSENLVIFGEVAFSTADDGLTGSLVPNQVREAFVGGVGVGVSYYFDIPRTRLTNLYVSASALDGHVDRVMDTTTGRSEID